MLAAVTSGGARVRLRAAALAALVAALLAPASGSAAAEVPEGDPAPPPPQAVEPAPPPSVVETIVVEARRVSEPLAATPAAVATIDADEIQLGRPQLGLDESLGRVPGLFATNRYNFAQGLRLSIRGFGARSGFGVRGLRVLVDGIPLTLPDGQVQTDGIDIASAGRIEVLRGPSSALYGAAAGGALLVTSEEPPAEPFAEARVAFGADGFARGQAKAAGELGPFDWLASGSHLRLDGHRDHARAESTIVNTRLRFRPDERSELGLVFGLVDSPEAQDPGGLTREQADRAPSQASAANKRFDAGEELDEERAGLVFRRELGDEQTLTARAHFLRRSLDNRLPFLDSGRVDLARLVGGGGLQYLRGGSLFGHAQSLAIGLDVDAQRDDRRRYDNELGRRGPLDLDQDEDVTAWGIYAKQDIDLWADVALTAALRFDQVLFRVQDHFDADGDQSDRLHFEHASPMAGLVWTPAPGFGLYGLVSTSFETPTTTELASPSGGGFDSSLEPQRAINYELGARGELFDRVRWDVAVFRVDVRDELVPYELPTQPGRRYFRNAGRSRREGVEAAVEIELLDGLVADLAYTWSDFRFERYSTPAGDFDGNRIPGIPEHQGFAALAYRHPSGVYAEWSVLAVDSVPANDANSAHSPSYWLSDLRLGARIEFGRFALGPFVGVNNLFDSEYDANVRINATGGRYFEPGPGLSVYGGLTLGYAF